jgi:hypothetical protein
MKNLSRAVLFLAFVATIPVLAQDARVQIDYLNRLGGKAVEAVDVKLDQELLRVLAASPKADEKLRDSLANLKGVYVKGFKFGGAGEYTAADVENLRSQLRGWEKVVEVRNKRGGDNGEIYLKLQGDKVVGLTIISAEPLELYVINVVGNINLDLDRISFEEGVRGISRLNVEWNRWMSKRRKGEWR